MDNLQTSKFKIDLKTMIYIGSILVSVVLQCILHLCQS